MIGLQAQEGDFIPRSGTMEIKLSKTHLEVGTKEPERSSDVDFLNETGTRARLGHKHPLFPLPLEIAALRLALALHKITPRLVPSVFVMISVTPDILEGMNPCTTSIVTLMIPPNTTVTTAARFHCRLQVR